MTTQEALRKCNSLHCGPQRRTAVYRLYDRSQRLLYVGIAHDTKRRWRQHAREKDWWGQVHWRTETWHASRLGAAIEEYCAIRFENPIYNKNREYDYRLGWEPGDSPGAHQPRPWRLGLMTAAARHSRGGSAQGDAEPHFAAVIRANQTLPGFVQLWVPQCPELGYWEALVTEGSTPKAAVHRSASAMLADHYGLEKGSFTVSVHDADSCSEPDLKHWHDLSDLPYRERIRTRWRRSGIGWGLLRYFGCTFFCTGICEFDNLENWPHYYPPVAVVAIGASLGFIGTMAWRFRRHLGYLAEWGE